MLGQDGYWAREVLCLVGVGTREDYQPHPDRTRTDDSARLGETHGKQAGMAEIVVVEDAQAAGELIADAVSDLIARKADAVLGLATGSTPLAVYSALAARKGTLDLRRVS